MIELRVAMTEEVLVLDGAMGTMVQRLGLGEAEFRGERFADHPQALLGCNDLLCLTRPREIAAIHTAYLDAGARIIETNTFNANGFDLGGLGLAPLCEELNRCAALLARGQVLARWGKDAHPCWVAGSIGPSAEALSVPGLGSGRRHTFSDFVTAYKPQIRGLLSGGVDLLLLETVFDGLCCKAVLQAYREVQAEGFPGVPLFLSATLANQDGRLLAGQTLEAFAATVAHARPLSFGLNCGFGAEHLVPHLRTLAGRIPTALHLYPNAGLPDEFGNYPQSADELATSIRPLIEEGLLSVVGGCCGTTPDHIAALSELVRGRKPGPRPVRTSAAPPCGLEVLPPASPRPWFVAERTSVAGSRSFRRAILENNLDRAVSMARRQLEAGATLLDVNLDDGLLDGPSAMSSFLTALAEDPAAAAGPVMLDSSAFEVLITGLHAFQGRPLVNSISLKDGEELFLQRAEQVQALGGVVLVQAMDERGQAEDAHRRQEILGRSHALLTSRLGFLPGDLVLDPNVLPVGTGLPGAEHQARDVLETISWVKTALPGTLVCCGVSNLSYAFKGHDPLRQAMHAVFLHRAASRGLDLAIVDPSRLPRCEDLDPAFRAAVEELLDKAAAEAVERVLALAPRHERRVEETVQRATPELATHLLTGELEGLEKTLGTTLAELGGDAVAVIEGPLLEGMRLIGERFAAGRCFLPQVVRASRVMKRAVDFLKPHLDAKAETSLRDRGAVVLATVRGDVHDIGKDLVAVVLRCHGYEVHDLGVKVPTERIVAAALENGVAAVGLSALITPSLSVMAEVARALDERGSNVPLLIGGAATSRTHTALVLAPLRRGPVLHVSDASKAPVVLHDLLDPARRETFLAANALEQQQVAEAWQRKQTSTLFLSYAEARERRQRLDWHGRYFPRPLRPAEVVCEEVPVREVLPLVSLGSLFTTFDLRGTLPDLLHHPAKGGAARALHADALLRLRRAADLGLLAGRTAHAVFPANSQPGEVLELYADERRTRVLGRLAMLRQQRPGADGLCRSLADLVAPAGLDLPDHVALLVATAGGDAAARLALGPLDDDYERLLCEALADRLAEALAEYVHRFIRRTSWGIAAEEALSPEDMLAERYRGGRYSPGYPSWPDHGAKTEIVGLLGAQERLGVSLTEHWAMTPRSTVCAIVLAAPEGTRFAIERVGGDQLAVFSGITGVSPEGAALRLSSQVAEEQSKRRTSA